MNILKFLTYIIFLIIFYSSDLKAQNLEVEITKNLRCLICQGQSVYDSQSEFAISMKLLIKEKLDKGNTEKEIYDFLKNQYGDWIVYDPKFDKKTILLWGFPLILFIFGGILIFRKVFIY